MNDFSFTHKPYDSSLVRGLRPSEGQMSQLKLKKETLQSLNKFKLYWNSQCDDEEASG